MLSYCDNIYMNTPKYSRRAFLGAALLICAAVPAKALFLPHAKKATKEENFLYIKKLCSMAQCGRFGKINDVRINGCEVAINGSGGFGRADFSSLSANAKDIANFRFDGKRTPLFERVLKEIS